MKEIDFTLYSNKSQTRQFGFKNDDNTLYDLTGSTVNLTIYTTPTNIVIPGNITILTGKVVFNFSTSDTATIGDYEYLIEETKANTSKLPLTRGNLIIKDYVPFSSTIEAFLNSELPANITLKEDFINNKITYWRLLLKDGFYVDELNMNLESSWPKLANILIAKLIVYDAMMLAAKGSFMAFMGGDYTSSEGLGAPVKAIETGPTKVEFESSSKAIMDIFKAGPDGSALDTMLSDLCGLANHLKIKIPMCKGRTVPIAPQYYQNPDWAYPRLGELDEFPNPVPSQG
jgi:hypothetical protein